MTDWPIRPAEDADRDALLQLWHDGWHDGHAGVVPDALKALRTRADFAGRLDELLADTLTAGPVGEAKALCTTLGDEIYQFYVAAEMRGTGLAARLIDAGEARIAAHGHPVARLDVAIGNGRAEAFYRKCGWHAEGPMEVALKTISGDFQITLLRMTKRLTGAG